MGAKSVLAAIAGVLVMGFSVGAAQAAAPPASAAAPAAATAAPAKKAALPNCGRACLEDLANQYFAALTAHNAKQLPLAKGVKYTENTIRMPLNEGVWATAESVDPAKWWVTDEKTHQVLVYTGVKEWQGQMAFLAVRLKAKGRQISEIEADVVRKYGGAQGNYDMTSLVKPDPLWDAPVPADKRTPRPVMAKVANLYFDGIEQSNGAIVPFENGDCFRIENHVQTAGPRPPGVPGGGEVAPNRPYESCATQFSSGRFHYINKVSNRRCDIDDETRGIAICIVMFQHPGTIHTWTDKATGQVNPIGGNFAKYPNNTYIWEAFKVENGHYRNIFAYVNVVPFLSPTGWEK